MQPSVMVVQTKSAQLTQIKTHPSARQKDEELKKELESMYDVLPPEVTNPVVKETKFVFLLLYTFIYYRDYFIVIHIYHVLHIIFIF